jgi:hypothetical protein
VPPACSAQAAPTTRLDTKSEKRTFRENGRREGDVRGHGNRRDQGTRPGQARTPLLLIHAFELFRQERNVTEGIAAGAGPVDAALLVNQDGGMQLHFLEIVIGMEAVGVGEMVVRKQPDG